MQLHQVKTANMSKEIIDLEQHNQYKWGQNHDVLNPMAVGSFFITTTKSAINSQRVSKQYLSGNKQKGVNSIKHGMTKKRKKREKSAAQKANSIKHHQ